jgi:RNA polymerase sigma-70 factor, ECF subfamily
MAIIGSSKNESSCRSGTARAIRFISINQRAACMDAKNEELMLEAARKGDEAAFVLLFEHHHETVFRFAYRMTGSETAAQDLTQECFLSLLQGNGRFNGNRASLRAYLYGMARNMARRHCRSSGKELSLEDQEEPLTTADADENIFQQEISVVIQRAIARLPLLQREALVLFEYENLTLDEIAQILEVDSGTVKSRMFRARENLRRILSPYVSAERRG